MKKIWIFVTILTLAALFFTTANVLASPAGDYLLKKTPIHTPGPRGTERGPGGDPHGNGNGNGNGNGGWNGAENGNGFDNHPGNGNGNDNHPGQGNGNPNNGQDQGGPHHGRPENYTGMIGAVDTGSLTLTLKDGSSLVFTLTDQTEVRIPTLGHSATTADLKVGQQVTIRTTGDDSQGLVAAMILVIPGKPEKIHRVGIVTDYQPGVSITIQDKDGETFTFLITPDTKILPPDRASELVVGVYVTIITPRDVTGGPLTAAGIVIHPKAKTPTPTITDTPMATDTATDTPTSTETPTATP